MLVEHGTLYTRAVELQGDMTYSPVSSGIFFPDGYGLKQESASKTSKGDYFLPKSLSDAWP